MTHAYNKSYLEDAMANLGAMLDYAVGICGEDLGMFWNRFIASGIAGQFTYRNPKYLCGLSGTELALAVAGRTGSPLPMNEPLIDTGSREYWTGWTLAYLQWYLNLPFETLQKRGIGASTLAEMYPTLHEADLMRSVTFVQKLLEERSGERRLRDLRKNAGLTQQELAEASGISLRAIRAYEQGQLSLAKASADSVYRLQSVLGVDNLAI